MSTLSLRCLCLKDRAVFALRRLTREQSGATAIDYGLIAALIAVVIIGALGTIGTNLTTKFTSVSTGLQ
jgi:pilus assembly protein Flp/PilA